MKIAVFGDSYAHNFELKEFEQNNDAVSWVEILAKKYDVTNYAMSGSSVYYSFCEFQKYHSEYDKVIFLVTAPGRLFLHETMKLELNTINSLPLEALQQHVNSAMSAEFMLNQVEMTNGSLEDKKRLTAIRDYFLLVMNIDEQRTYSQLMAKEVQTTRPDALVQLVTGSPRKDLWSISKMELEHWGETQPSINQRDLFEIRKNHLTKENNIILANKIEQWIIHGTPLDLSLEDFVKPTEPIEKYFIKRTNWSTQ